MALTHELRLHHWRQFTDAAARKQCGSETPTDPTTRNDTGTEWAREIEFDPFKAEIEKLLRHHTAGEVGEILERRRRHPDRSA